MILALQGKSPDDEYRIDLSDAIPPVTKQDRRTQINGNAAFFLGVSIGCSFIRIVLLGLDLKPVSRDTIENVYGFKVADSIRRYEEEESGGESYKFKTPNEDNPLFKIREIVTAFIQPMLDYSTAPERQSTRGLPAFRLMGIGFGVSGPVDYEEKVWLSAPHISKANNITLQDLMGSEAYHQALANDVFLSLDNNAKAAMVSEFQGLVEREQTRNPGDVAVLYVGTGIGTAAVVGRKLLRGNRNLSGEAGQLRIVVENSADSSIHDEVIEDHIKYDETDDYYKYLPFILNAITCMTGVERIIFLGHSIAKISNFVPNLMDYRLAFTVKSTHAYCRPEAGRNLPYTAAIGAAIEAYCTMCNFDLDGDSEDRINLAYDISW